MTRARSHRRRTKPLRLLQFTDLHLCAENSGRVKGMETTATFARCLEHARAHHSPVDAILLTGDLVQDDSRAYLELAALMAPEASPVHCLPGNHDLPAEMEALLGRPPFDMAPVLRYGDWTLVQLDSSVSGAAHGQLVAGEPGVSSTTPWRGLPTATCWSYCITSPCPSVRPGWTRSGSMNGPELLQVVARHRNVRGMLWGHVHQSFDGMHGGVAMMSTPSTCFQFVPGRDDFAIDDRPPGYRWLHLYPDGRIDTRVVWVPAE